MEKRQIPLTCGIPGTETAITAFCYGPVQGVRKVYVQASLHADELPGSLAAWQLCERLQALELQERVRAATMPSSRDKMHNTHNPDAACLSR